MCKKIIALLSALALILALACGCKGNGGSTQSGSPSASQSAAPSQSQAAPSQTPPASDPAQSMFPLEQPLTYNVWFPDCPPAYNYVDDWAEAMKCTDAIEQLTNVYFNWTFSADAQVGLATIIASGEWPDVFFEADRYYNGGLEKMYADGITLDLTDKIEARMPNYWRLISSDDELKRQVTTSANKFLGLYCVKTEPDYPQGGMLVRTDWLKEWGMSADAITTYDDYQAYLEKAKSEYGAQILLQANMVSSYLSAGFNVAADVNTDRNSYPFYFREGKALFGPMQPEFKEYLQYMNKLYTSGLISDKTGAWTNPMNPDKSAIVGGSVSMVPFQFMIVGEIEALADDPNYGLTGVTPAVKNKGDKIYIGSNEIRRSNSVAVSSKLEDVDTFLAFADWGYTQAGTDAYCYGVEGRDYTKDKDGNVVYADGILTESVNVLIAGMIYFLPQDGPHLFDTEGYLRYYDQKAVENMKRAKSSYADKLWSKSDALTILEKDNGDYVSAIGDIGTYVLETVPQFIMGTKPLSDFDGFVAKMKEMGAEKTVQYWQNAYDAYYER